MKSKKILLFVIALIGTFMINIKGVFALDISVSDVKVNKKGGDILLGDTSFDDKNINSSIEFNELNDYVIYQITLKNNDSEDYTIDSIKDNNTNENISVSYSYDDKKISSKGTQNIYVTLKYNKKLYNKESISLDDLTFTLNLLDSKGNSKSTIINPITGDSILRYILIFIVSLILIFFGLLLIKRRKSKLFLVFLIALIPSVVFAKKNLSISIRFTNITIKGEMLPYTVSIKDSNGNSTERTVIYGQPVGNLPEVSKVGYTFDKYEDQDGNKITEDTIVKGNLTVTPKFNPITYDITYDYAGGNASNPEHYTIEDDITLSQPTRNGYTFLGWTGTNINTVQNSVRIQNSTGNLNFVAHWSTNQNTPYRVIHKYQKLDGTYEEVVQNLEGPTDEEVTVALLNRDGFTGPQQLTSITIVAVENEEDIPTVTYTYTRNNYSLTLNNDIETTFTNPTYPYGTKITLTAKDKDNYEFIKWSNGETTKTITFNITGNTEIYPIYSGIKYTVTYDPMDGEISPTSQEVNAGESITTLPIPTAPTGKSFDGWYTEETGGSKVNGGYTPTGNITLYARYYTDISGSTITPSSISVKVGETSTIVVNDIEEEYTFESSDTNIAAVNNNGVVTGTGVGTTTITITGTSSGKTKTIDVTVTQSKYTVTYNAGEGTISPTTQEVNVGSSITTLPIPTAPTGKSFDGWYTEETGGNKVNDGYTPTGDITLYARYSVQSYTVSFNTNGGSNVPSQTIEYGGKVTRPTTNPTKTNYIFVNWYTDDSYNTVFDFDNTTITSNTIVYAKFKQDTFPVVFSEPGECTFNGSNGVLTGTNCSYANGINKYIDTGINLYNTSNHDKDYEIGFTIVSYDYSENVTQATFMNTKLEGNNYPGLVFRRKNSENVFDFSSRKASSANQQKFYSSNSVQKVKIYRIYNEANDVQEIYVQINDGEKELVNDLSQYNPTFDLSVWFGAAPTDASATSAQRILVGTMKDMYIKVGKYEEDNSEKYIVTFNANGGSVTPASKRIDIDSPIGTLPTPTAPSGKTFIGWYTELNGGEQVTSSYMPNTDKTIYARYYKDVTGATVSPSSISILNGASETLSISNVEEEYTFSSNNINIATVDSTGKVTGTGVGTTTITITGTSSGKTKTVNVTVESSTYTVTLNPNGGTVTTTSITQNKGTAIGELPTPTAPSGKTFIGWYTELNGGEQVTSSYMSNTDKTIYARYYKDVTGATVSPSSISILNGASETLSISNVEEEYTFRSNNTNIATVDSNGKVTGTGVGTTTITITGSSSGKTKTVNVTVESSTYTVTLNPNGGTLTTTSITQNKGTAIGELPTPTAPTGKEFDGWYTGIDIGEKVTSSYTPNSNVTIYARYNSTCGTFATDSWSTIRDNLESNSSYYAVGCEKEVEMDMDDDGTNESYTVRLANTSTPEVCSTEGYSQTACGFVIEFVDIVTRRKMKNSTGGNAGGWKETTMVDYLNSDFYNKLPNNLQSVIIPTYPIISGSGSGGKSKDITSDDINKDKVFLLAAKEINASTSNDNKSYKTKTLDYYISHNSNTYRDKYDLLGESKTWWLRTADKNSSYGFIAIKMNAQLVESSMANTILGVAPAFRIGTMPSFTVTFDTDEGSSVTSQTIIYGEKATRPTTDPTKTGLAFDNWYTDDTYTTVFDFDNTVITSNTTIYAHFIDPCNGFSTDSWSTIRDNLENDSSYYAVGCEKEVEMDINNDGTNESYTVRLANTSTPEACETEGYSQTACGTVIEFANIITTHRMNPYANCSENGNCNKGGWEYSDMRAYLNNTIYEAGNINYSTIGIYNALPTELKNTIIDTTVVSGHGTNDSANFITSDKLYLLSSVEVWGSPYDDTVTTALTRQLDYYEDLGVTTSNYSSTLKRLNNGANYWWLRSAGSNDNYSFSIVTFNNPSNSYLCNYEFAVSPAFRIGTNN